MRSLRKVWGDEKGASIVFVAIALVVILGFAVLAIDASMMQLAKTQLQNAADAGALAGAMAWATSNMGSEDSVRAEAIRVAGLNVAIQDTQSPVLNPDVYTLDLPNLNKVTVTTYRTKAHADPVTLYFLKVLNPLLGNKGDITAKATARVFQLSATDCLKPFCPPDKWNDANGNGKCDPGEYDPNITGYQAPRDIGVQVTLKLSNPGASPRMGWYYPVVLDPSIPGGPGGEGYREWIYSCPSSIMIELGDQLEIKPGNMVGPTNQGLDDLIHLDPTAQWDPVTQKVINSAYPVSPRVIKAAAFDPRLGVQSCGPGRDCVTVIKFLVIFVEDHHGGDVVGRFMKMATEGEPCLGPDCPQGFVYKVALVK
jgi:Flp pilus assembly protein TadG